MRNPFQYSDNYAIKVNYNRMRSRSNSRDSVKSFGEEHDPYKLKKYKQVAVGNEYRTQLTRKKNIELESAKVYGPQSLRYHPTYLENIKRQQERGSYLAKDNSIPWYKSRDYSSTHRDNDSMETQGKIKIPEAFTNSNSYNFNLMVSSPRRKRGLTADNFRQSYDLSQRNPTKKSSIYHLLRNRSPSQLQAEDQCIASDNGNDTQANLPFKSIPRLDTLNQKKSSRYYQVNDDQSPTQTVIKSARTLKSTKSLAGLRKTQVNLALQSRKMKREPDRIKVKGRHFFSSPYFQI